MLGLKYVARVACVQACILAEKLAVMSFSPADHVDARGMARRRHEPPAPMEAAMHRSLLRFSVDELLAMAQQEREAVEQAAAGGDKDKGSGDAGELASSLLSFEEMRSMEAPEGWSPEPSSSLAPTSKRNNAQADADALDLLNSSVAMLDEWAGGEEEEDVMMLGALGGGESDSSSDD